MTVVHDKEELLSNLPPELIANNAGVRQKEIEKYGYILSDNQRARLKDQENYNEIGAFQYCKNVLTRAPLTTFCVFGTAFALYKGLESFAKNAPPKVQNKKMRHRLYWQSAAVLCMAASAVESSFRSLPLEEQQLAKDKILRRN